MARSMQSSEKDGMIYRRSDLKRRQEGLVGNLDGIVRAAPAKAKEKPAGASILRLRAAVPPSCVSSCRDRLDCPQIKAHHGAELGHGGIEPLLQFHIDRVVDRST
ncbi:hypothetical protein ACH4L7_21840 [Streptomyces anulatus]